MTPTLEQERKAVAIGVMMESVLSSVSRSITELKYVRSAARFGVALGAVPLSPRAAHIPSVRSLMGFDPFH